MLASSTLAPAHTPPLQPHIMEDTIELVAKHCSSQLNSYQRCILANQGSPQACDTLRQELSSCAADSVPLLSTIKKRCQGQVQAYDLCLKQGENDNDEQLSNRCIGALRNLHLCTEAARREAMGQNISNQIGIK